jgi:hypothetical protein
MKTKRMAERAGAVLLALAFALALIAPGISAADREAGPGEVLLLSDEIFGNSVEVTRPGDGENGGNDNNRSGLGDGTNPGQGDGRDNTVNDGTDNPGGSDSNENKGGKKK